MAGVETSLGAKKRLLLVTPFSPDIGYDHAANDIAGPLVQSLAALFDLHIYAANAPDSGTPLEILGATLHPTAGVVRPGVFARRMRALCNLSSPYPWRLRLYWRRADSIRAAQLARELRVDHVHIEYLQPAEVMKYLPADMPRTITIHDVTERVAITEAQSQISPLKRAHSSQDAAKVARVERWAIRSADAVIAFSERHSTYAREVGARAVSTVRLGVTDERRPEWANREAVSSPRLVFSGAMWREPNELAALFLAEQVMPLVWGAFPSARLRIVGARPTPRVVRLSAWDGRVEVTGEVADYGSELAHADLVLAPTVVEAGVLLKVLRAMALDRPVVVNSLAAAPITELRHGTHALVADSPQEWASAITQALMHPGATHAMAQAGGELVRRTFNWQACASDYAKTIAAAVARRVGD